MPDLSPLGRILFAAIFVLAAPRHFSHEGIAHAAAHGVPMASILVPLSGVMALVGGLSVILGVKARVGAWLLIAFLVPVTLWMHAFWKLSDPALMNTQRAMFVKNISMLGAALYIAHFGAGRFSIDAARAEKRRRQPG